MDGSRSPPGLKPDRGRHGCCPPSAQKTDKKWRTELGHAARVMKAIRQAFRPCHHEWFCDSNNRSQKGASRMSFTLHAGGLKNSTTIPALSNMEQGSALELTLNFHSTTLIFERTFNLLQSSTPSDLHCTQRDTARHNRHAKHN